jgi:hypothetical protein
VITEIDSALMVGAPGYELLLFEMTMGLPADGGPDHDQHCPVFPSGQ